MHATIQIEYISIMSGNPRCPFQATTFPRYCPRWHLFCFVITNHTCLLRSSTKATHPKSYSCVSGFSIWHTILRFNQASITSSHLFLHGYTTMFIPSPVDGHLDFFFLTQAIVIKAAIEICVQLLRIIRFHLSGFCCMHIFSFIGNHQVFFSMVAAHFTFSPAAQEFQWLTSSPMLVF